MKSDVVSCFTTGLSSPSSSYETDLNICMGQRFIFHFHSEAIISASLTGFIYQQPAAALLQYVWMYAFVLRVTHRYNCISIINPLGEIPTPLLESLCLKSY